MAELMSPGPEYEAAYFTLLRAREELDGLMAYGEYLERERERLDRFVADTREQGETVPAKVRKPVDRTAKAMVEAVGRRRGVVLDELRRLEDRVSGAQEFVRECEDDLARLRS